jgi:hypothetical protein
MTSLPRDDPARLQQHPKFPDIVSAYNICLRVERSLQEDVNKGDNVEKKLIYIRLLGYLMHHSPRDQGVTNVAREIFSAPHDSDLLDVGKTYFDHYIRACTFPNLRVQYAI